MIQDLLYNICILSIIHNP